MDDAHMNIDWQPLINSIAGFIVIMGVPTATLIVAIANRRQSAEHGVQLKANAAKLAQVQQQTDGALSGLVAQVGDLRAEVARLHEREATHGPGAP